MKPSAPIRRLLYEFTSKQPHVVTFPHDSGIPPKRPSDFTSNPLRVSAPAHEANILKEILSILRTESPMEDSLERYVLSLYPDMVTSVLREESNPEKAFRFFIWAMRRKCLRCFDSHNLVIDKLVRDDGFRLFWGALEEVKRCGFPVPSLAFCVLVQAYAKSGADQKAVESFCRMKDFDCQPDVFTYNTFLHFLFQKNLGLLALAVYNEMLKLNLCPSRATFSILIDGLCKTGKTQEALKLFDNMSHHGVSPDTTTYTIILSGLSQANRTDDVRSMLCSMKQSGCYPNEVTYTTLLNGFCRFGEMDEAISVLQSFQKDGYILDLQGYSCLIDGLFKARRFKEAREWYRKMCDDGIMPDIILYTIMIWGCLKEGMLTDALRLVNEMTERGLVPDTHCYNALIKGFCDAGLLDKARSLQLEISKNGCFPDTSTYTIIICGLCRIGLLRDAQDIFEEMEKHGCLPSVVTFNFLIDGLCKAGELREAHLQFYKMEIGKNPSLFVRLTQGSDRVHDTSSLQSMVQRLTESGQILKAYNILRKLVDSGVVPNIVTYNILINGYCKSRNVNAAFNLFRELQHKGLSPTCVTYGTLIDGLQSVGREKDAFSLFDHMLKGGCTPNLAAYKILMIWSCRNGRLPVSYNLWLKRLRNHSGREYGPILQVEEHFERGEVELAVRSLLEMDFKYNDFELAPYVIWIIGLCNAEKPDEAFKIFSMLMEWRISVNAEGCVALIKASCQRGDLNRAANIFRYCLDKSFILSSGVCNMLLQSLLQSEDYITHVFGFLRKMKSLRYDPGILVYTTKSLLHSRRRTRKEEGHQLDKSAISME